MNSHDKRQRREFWYWIAVFVMLVIALGLLLTIILR